QEALRELWRSAYLEAAGTPRREPAPADGSAWWVYCVVASTAAARLPDGLRGVVPGAEVETVTGGQLAAVVSAVPLAEFNDERLREHLEDLAWVEHVARAHESVLESVMATTTIVPLRLCTICLSPERVAALLDEQAAGLAPALDALRGRTEWGVKLFGPLAGPTEPEAEAADGSAYLERRRRARGAREEAQRAATDCAQHIHDALGRETVASAVNPPQRPEAHGRDAEMLLNAAYLIDDERREALRGLVESLAAEHEPAGFALELTGPWPPYNFVAPSAPALS
ncbi:MAG: GvpL/GvpF family gas vesicle protein, partial [Solirubrobacteraceae bacterium]